MKKKLLFFWLMLLTMGFGSFAQTTITIGTGTSSDHTFPFNNNFRNSWNEMIYPASDITERGYITSLGFDVSSVADGYMCNTLTIYMGVTSNEAHNSNTDWLPMDALTEVYSVTDWALPTAIGWLTFDLDNPFQYESNDNLVIVVSKTMPNYTNGLKFCYTEGATNCCLYRRNDNDLSYASHPGGNIGTLTNQLPNLQLTFSTTTDFCHSVTNFVITDISAYDATFAWTAPESASNYILQYKTADQTWSDEDVYTINTTDTTFYLNGLTAVTTYNVRVASYCGSDTSAWKTVIFSTPCEATWNNLPYVEDFEGYPTHSIPDCWTRLQTYTSGSTVYPYITNSTTAAHSGTGYLYSYGGNNFIALPCFSEPVNNLRLTFWMKPVGTTSAYGHVEVGVMSDMDDANSFQSVASWYSDTIGSTEWRKYMVDFTDITPSDSDHIVIRRYVSSTYGWYFDDVSVDYIPTCEAPTELTAVGATTNSVTLKWNPGEESNFKVFYKALGDEDYTEVSGVYLDADSTYTLTGLEPATNYTVYVSSVCFDGSETASDPFTCATTMEPAELPYTTDFSENADQNWMLNNGTCTNYWTMGAIGDTVPGALFVTNNGTTPEYTIVSAISMVSASKLFTIGTAPQVHIGFDVMMGGESFFDYIKLFFSPETEQYPAKAGVVPTTSEYGHNAYSLYAFDFSDYAPLSIYSSATSYPYRYNLTGGNVVHIDALMPNPHENPDANSTAQVVFVWKNDNSGGTQPSAIISNVTIDIPSCFRPENLVATNITPQSADLSWDGGNANSWTVEYGTHEFTLGTGTVVDVTGNPETTLTGLADNTEYDVYVKTICGDEESPNKIISFTTPCLGLTSVPQTWDMESNLLAGSSSYPLPECWTRIGSGTSSQYPYAYNYSTYAHSGTRSLYFNNSYPHAYAIMPYIDPTVLDIHNLQVSFFAWANNASAYSSLQVGVMTDPTDAETFTPVRSFSITTSYPVETYDVPFSEYTGNGNYIAFRNVTTGSATNSFYVDDITLMEIPTCSKAKNLAAMPDTHEADLTWTGSGSSFNLYYKTTADSDYTIIQGLTLTDGSYQLTGLTAATEYTWYIVTNCDDGTTYTSNNATFVTACEGLTTVPQFWNFDDNLIAGTSSYPLPTCWNRISTSTTNTQYPYAYSSTTYSISSPRVLYFYNSYLNSLAIMPGINPDVLNLTDLQVSFYARLSNANENVRLLVGVMDSPSDASSFTVVDTIVLTNAHPVEPFVVKFDEYEGSGTYVAFKNVTVTGATVSNSIYIDDVTLEEIPACSAPTNAEAFPASNSVDLRWDNMTEGTYNVYYKADTDEVYIELLNVVVSDNYYTIDNLDALTTYDFYVAAVCNDGSESAAHEHSFTTLCEVFSAPFMEDFNATNTLPDCWEKATGLASAFAGVNPTATTSGWMFTNYNVFGHNHAKLNIYGTACKYWLITPEIDLSSLSDPALVFDLALTDYNNANPIEDLTSQADDKFMVIVSTIHGGGWSASNATVWSNEAGADHVYNQISYTGEEVVIDLSEYAGETIRIAFYGESTATGGDNDLHIDNVVVGEMPACAAPSQLAVSDITDATATIHWTENGDATSWVVEYGIEGFTIGTGDVVTVTDTFATLTGLVDATHYYVYVKAVCDNGSYSNLRSTMFETSCLPISLPYTQNFDSYSTGSAAEFVDCWRRFNNYSGTANYPYVSNVYAVSGINSLYFYNTSSTYSVAVLPMLDPTVNPINTLQISFNLRTTNTSSKIVVGAMTNPLDFNTFTPIDTVENTVAGIFELMEVSLSSYTGNASYVALRLLNTSNPNAAYIDDITLTDCKPLTLPYFETFEFYTESTTASTGITPDCWELVQEDVPMSDENRPQLYYKSSYAHSGNYSLLLNYRGIYAMPILEENTPIRDVHLGMYLRQPRAYYALQVGIWENDGTFVPVATFNNETTGVEYVECDFSEYTGNGRRIAFRNIPSGNDIYNYSYNYIDDITLTEEEGCELTIEMHDSFGDSWTGNKIRVHNDGFVKEVTLTEPSDGSVTVQIHSGLLELEWVNGTYPEDCSFTVIGPSCLYYSDEEPMEGVFFSTEIDCDNNSTPVPAFSYWTESTCSSVMVHFENVSTNAESAFWDFGDGTGSEAFAPTHEYTTDGTYSVTLSVLNSSCESTNSITVDVTVTMPESMIKTLPFTENFDSYTEDTTATTGVEPTCWELVQEDVPMSDENRPQLYCKSSYAHSGDYSIRLKYRGVYAMPPLSKDIAIKHLHLEMYLRQPKTYYALEVGVWEDSGTFVPVATFNNSTTGMTRVECDFSEYTGNGRRIAFRNIPGSDDIYNYSYNYIDDITLIEAEGCELTVEMHDSYGDSWTGNKIRVHTDGFVKEVTLTEPSDGSVTVQIHSGLLELEWVNGTYPEDCSFTVTGTSCFYYSGEAPSEGVFFSSEIDCNNNSAPAVPAFSYWAENTCNGVIVHFENESTNAESAVWNFGDGTSSEAFAPTHEYTTDGTYSVTLSALNSSCESTNSITLDVTVTMPEPIITLPYFEDFESHTTITKPTTGAEPCSWELVQEDVQMPDNKKPQLYYKSEFAHSGNYSLMMNYRGVYAMPELSEETPMNIVHLEMYLRQPNAAYQLEVGVWDGQEFVPVKRFNNNGTDVKYVACEFSNYTGNGRRIAFRNVLADGANYNYSYNYIDDITLTACEPFTLPYFENFEFYTESSTASTGVQPDCWTLVQEDVDMTDATHPQLYNKSQFAHSGNYSLMLNYRGVYAMPVLSSNTPVNQISLEMYLRQPNAAYQLEVGVWNDETETFESLHRFNNSTTGVERVECDFSNYSGNGRRIAFRNVLGGGANYKYSYNYIDDITLTELPYTECGITLPYSEDFESYTLSTTTSTGVKPKCWEVVQEDVAMTNSTRPQLYYKSSFAHSGSYSLKMGYRCVYAMPVLLDDVPVNQVSLDMYLRQANAAYQLQVGVWEDEEGVFVPVATFNNSTTNVEHVTCDFSSYNGNGRRIAFRNVLGSGANYAYSYNYLDDITLSYTENTRNTAANENNFNGSDIGRLLESVTVYPNPTKDFINVQCSMNDVQCSGIEVIDVYGKVIYTVVGANNDSPTQINVSNLAAGMYFVRVTTDKGAVMKPFVKR